MIRSVTNECEGQRRNEEAGEEGEGAMRTEARIKEVLGK